MTLQYHKGDCRHLLGNIKNTTKKTLFCYPCGHVTYVENKTCQCCLKKITKKQDHESDLKKFEKIYCEFKTIIDLWNEFPNDTSCRPFFPIKMGHKVFAVNIKHIAEYAELTHLEGNGNKYKEFILTVQAESVLIGISVI